MHNVASIAPMALKTAANDNKPAGAGISQGVKNLFLLLQGSYGNLFLSKFATGIKDDAGRDLGIRATMKVWEAALSKFPAQVIETAANRLTNEHPEFPPNLPQFVKSCEAAMPRKTYAEENGLKALPPPPTAPQKPVSYERKGDTKDWARAILAQHESGFSKSPTVVRFAKEALGLNGRMAWQ